MTQSKLLIVDIADNIQKNKKEKKGEKNKYIFKLKNKWTGKQFTLEFNYLNDSDFFKSMRESYFQNELIKAHKIINGKKVNIKINV